jgi:hypothetical protein
MDLSRFIVILTRTPSNLSQTWHQRCLFQNPTDCFGFAGYVSNKQIKLMPFIYFTAKTSQELALICAFFVGTLCDTGFWRQRDKLRYPSKLVAHETGHICSAQHMVAAPT